MEIIVAILPIRADWKGLYHYLTAVFLESNYEMSSSHHDMDTETRTSRHSPDPSRSEDSSSKTALPLKNIAKSGAGANICQVFAIVIISSLSLTSALQWEWTQSEQISRQEFEKLIVKTEHPMMICVMYISNFYLFCFWTFSDFLMCKKLNTRNMETWSDLIVMCRCSTKWGLKQSSTLVSCQASGTKHLHRQRCVTNIRYGELEIKAPCRRKKHRRNHVTLDLCLRRKLLSLSL